MTTNRLVGSVQARVAAAGFGLALLGVLLMMEAGSSSRFYLALVLGLLTWISLVHAFRRLFSVWMRFAEALHHASVTLIFGVCYLAIVPLFRILVWFRDPLHLRRSPHDTAWVTRTARVDARSLERMG